jgi:tRNA A37 threonylcarbamoyladenosine modification protein TsaB
VAFAGRKPLIGVSAFEALERSLRLKPEATAKDPEARGEIATWVDAWRGEVYAALYKDGREVVPPVVGHPDELLVSLRAADAESRGPITFIGDAAETYRDLIRRTLGNRARIADPASPLLAGVIAQLASEAASSGEPLPPPHAIHPLYVRRPDAELARAQRVR